MRVEPEQRQKGRDQMCQVDPEECVVLRFGKAEANETLNNDEAEGHRSCSIALCSWCLNRSLNQCPFPARTEVFERTSQRNESVEQGSKNRLRKRLGSKEQWYKELKKLQVKEAKEKESVVLTTLIKFPKLGKAAQLYRKKTETTNDHLTSRLCHLYVSRLDNLSALEVEAKQRRDLELRRQVLAGPSHMSIFFS